MSTTVEDDSAALPDKTSCPTCASLDVRSATRTPGLVYLRCEGCGYVWSVPERRKGHGPYSTPKSKP
jgi:hypothetical protein